MTVDFEAGDGKFDEQDRQGGRIPKETSEVKRRQKC
jgi:hypothetical protein